MKEDIYILIQKDKEQAFREIVATYTERIYWQVRKLVLDHDDANDITQEVFVRAWSSLDKFKGESKMSTWLTRIAFNQSYTFLEKSKITGQKIDISDVELQAPSRIDEIDVSTRLIEALGTLPPKQRLVFSLKYFDDMKYDEMAKLLDSSVGGLKASYHHAVQKIKLFITEIKPLDY